MQRTIQWIQEHLFSLGLAVVAGAAYLFLGIPGLFVMLFFFVFSFYSYLYTVQINSIYDVIRHAVFFSLVWMLVAFLLAIIPLGIAASAVLTLPLSDFGARGLVDLMAEYALFSLVFSLIGAVAYYLYDFLYRRHH